jgi:hypothetical protein
MGVEVLCGCDNLICELASARRAISYCGPTPHRVGRFLMFRSLVSISITLGVMTAAIAADPKFSFVESETTKKHIAVQPKDEHHRVYFPLRVENAKGKAVFARVRCQPEGDKNESVQTVRFDATTDNDLWRVYLRAPRHEDKTATYQVEVGEYNTSNLDPESVRASYTWQVVRSPGKVDFVTNVTGPDGKTRPVMSLPIIHRAAVISGGSVKIVFETVNTGNPDLKFGLDGTAGKDVKVDGSGAFLVK